MKYALAAIGAACLGFAGCAELTSDIDKTEAFLASPEAAAAANTLKSGAQGFVCTVSNVGALTTQIEAQIAAGKAAQTTTGKIVTVSSDVCAAMGGTVAAQTILK
ncbi:MAG TPA: hypothetical protein VME69_06570 [Methylocella sp.]|nr:hypothetical protein [Methylocella sp.]